MTTVYAWRTITVSSGTVFEGDPVDLPEEEAEALLKKGHVGLTPRYTSRPKSGQRSAR